MRTGMIDYPFLAIWLKHIIWFGVWMQEAQTNSWTFLRLITEWWKTHQDWGWLSSWKNVLQSTVGRLDDMSWTTNEKRATSLEGLWIGLPKIGDLQTIQSAHAHLTRAYTIIPFDGTLGYNQNCWRIFWKLVCLLGLKAVEHFAIVMLFLDTASVM